MNIPKVIHYCWFGGKPLPASAIRCIESWEKFLPDYEIKRWDESNFDVYSTPYTSSAYEAKKYAFVSDYARFWILYNFGGLYFDTDVEIIRCIDDIIAKGPFMGCENPYEEGADEICIAPGLGLGATPGLGIYKEIIDFYRGSEFKATTGANPETVVTYVSKILYNRGFKNLPGVQLIDDIYIYPSEYFCPISTYDGKLRITKNTRSIHHYDQTWQSPWRKYGRKVLLTVGGAKLKNAIKKLILK